ncbi:hypothetical protein B1NLA3E_05625 [Bacillus sp. 1NLA3E]|nr:hypothetical protein B1NLA3E_05625 [Bacillus sp. 1NLA3E]
MASFNGAFFYFKAMLKLNVDFFTMLIGVEGTKTPAGAAGQVRPHRRISAEEAHRPPLRCASAWNGNQHFSLTEPISKIAGFCAIFKK